MFSTVILSLPKDYERRAHVKRHFAEIGIKRFRFETAIGWDAEPVRAAYLAGKVAQFPGCFRCCQQRCACANNILIPSQVANFLSFAQIWAVLAQGPLSQFTLICEDDVLFRPTALSDLYAVLKEQQNTAEPLLIRLAQSGLDPASLNAEEPAQLSNRVVMSNAAYVINGAMASYLTRHFDQITTTSDLWLHQEIAAHPEIKALTLEPLLATDLSYNVDHAQFASRIHPKGVTEHDRRIAMAHVKRVEDENAYQKLLQSWVG